jgi:hypothetical protein
MIFKLYKDIKMFIINKQDNIFEKVKELVLTLKTTDKPIFVFDIHKTTLTKEGKINKEINIWIKDLVKKKFNVFFLSYDGQIDRIPINYNLLHQEKIYKNIPTIFMMKRKKYLVLSALEKLIKVDRDYKIRATLIDDNFLNIKDMKKLDKEIFEAIHFKN